MDYIQIQVSFLSGLRYITHTVLFTVAVNCVINTPNDVMSSLGELCHLALCACSFPAPVITYQFPLSPGNQNLHHRAPSNNFLSDVPITNCIAICSLLMLLCTFPLLFQVSPRSALADHHTGVES